MEQIDEDAPIRHLKNPPLKTSEGKWGFKKGINWSFYNDFKTGSSKDLEAKISPNKPV